MNAGLVKMLDLAGQIIDGLERENAALAAEVQRLQAEQSTTG